MNLVLIGYRGTGKSVLSRILHQRMNLPVVHMDTELETRFGCSIAAFVELHGWELFRDEEEKLARELASRSHTIVDTGGGVVEREPNRTALRSTGFVVWLQSSTEAIARRIAGDANRPSLSGDRAPVDEIREILQKRTPWYQSMAHVQITTDGCSLPDVADWIQDQYREKISRNLNPPDLDPPA